MITMTSIYLLLLAFKIGATLACIIYCFKTARLRLTQTYTWMLFCFAFMLRFITQIQALIYARDILGLYANFNIWVVIMSQLMEAVIVGAFLIGIARSYYGVKNSTFFLIKNSK